MTRLFVTTFFIVAVGVYASPFADVKSLSGKTNYPTDLGWLFIPKKHHNHAMDRSKERAVCESEECQKIARVLRESINDSVDPCTDFYNYACDNWAAHNPIPKDKPVWNMVVMIQEKVNNFTAGILKEDNQPDDVLPLKLARKLYKSCMDLDDMDRRGLEPMVITLARSGGWPMILEPEEYDENGITWQKIDDYYIRLTGQLTFFDVNIRPYLNDTKYMPSLSLPDAPVGGNLLSEDDDESDSTEKPDDSEEEPGSESDSQEKGSKEKPSDKSDEKSVGEEGRIVNKRGKREADSKKTYTSKERKEKYRQFIIQVTMAIAQARGFPITVEKIAQDVEDLLEFMTKMQKLRYFPVVFEPTTLKEFQEWYDGLGFTSETSKINWIRKLSIIFDDANMEIDENFEIVVNEMEYIESVAALLEETSPRTIVNYVHWRIGSHALKATTRDMRKLIDDLTKSTYSSQNDDDEEDEMEKREKFCTHSVEANTIIGYEYVKRHFDENSFTEAKRMIKDIQKVIQGQIEKCDWMDENTKLYALNKLGDMTSLVGYPKWYENKTAVNSYYKGLVVSPSYFENVISVSKRKNGKALQLTQKSPTDFDENDVQPTIVNAYYVPWTNTIVITAADLQGPFFDATRPAMVNFGIIGLIIGHEINHGFDSKHFGEEKPGMEALNVMTNVYGMRAGCFVEQYNNYAEESNLFNGTVENYGNQTSGENIADSMGLHAVFHAYKNREKENGRPEPTLPGFENTTNDQLFFLSFANMWCETVDKKMMAQRYRYDSHSPGKLRVIGPLSNSAEFAEAYNCPVGSPMNPEKKCDIWA